MLSRHARAALGAAIVLVTWVSAAIGWFAASVLAASANGPDRGNVQPAPELVLRTLTTLMLVAALVACLALLRGASWHRRAYWTWAGTVLATATSWAVYAPGGPFTAGALQVVAIATAVVGALGWASGRVRAPSP